MEVIILLNIAAVAVAYLILGLPARRIRQRLNAAEKRLADTTVDKTIQANFMTVRQISLAKSGWVFWVALAGLFIGLYFVFQTYASSVEARASIEYWVLVNLTVYGVGLLGIAFVLSSAVTVYWQTYKTNALMNQYVITYPNSPVLREVRETIAPRIGEAGVSVVAAIAVVGCALYGLALVAIFYAAAQTAIECARSSKCM